MKEQDVLISVFEGGPRDLPDSVVEMIDWLNEKLDVIPSEYRESAFFEIEGGYDDPTEIKIAYWRKETAEEVEQRLARAEHWEAQARNRELQELSYLLSKYGKDGAG